MLFVEQESKVHTTPNNLRGNPTKWSPLKEDQFVQEALMKEGDKATENFNYFERFVILKREAE